jgi:phospholipase/lecithinase/hemolysin
MCQSVTVTICAELHGREGAGRSVKVCLGSLGMHALRQGWVVAALLFVPVAAARADLGMGIGVLGDSYSDEYQFYPPHRSTARNWVEILTVTRGLNFGQFSTTSRGEPRNQGFAYNWARSDAETEDLIATGQHTGLAAQVARGEVKIVFIFIGGNDFIHALQSPDPMARLDEVLPRALRNYRTAFETILAADPEVKLVVATLPDIRDLPEFAGPIREGRLSSTLAEAYTRAIRRYNAQIRVLALRQRRVALLDLDLVTRLANQVSFEHAFLMGRQLDRRFPSNAIDHVFLADSRHMGTLGHGLIAQLFIETLNRSFGAAITPLSDQEILRFATTLAAPPPAMDLATAAEVGKP